jgi:hypothetical protein
MKKHFSAVRHELQKITLFSALFLSVGVTAWGQIPNYVPANGLVGWWPFNGNANDQSGNNLNGSVTGATLTTDRNGVANSCYNFNYTNWSWGSGGDEIYIPYNALFNTSNLTVSVWVNRASSGYTNQQHTIINRYQYGYSNPNGQTWQILAGSAPNCNISTVVYQAAPNNSQAFVFHSGPNLELNNWTNIVLTFDGLSKKQYVNGVLVATVPANGLLLNTAGNSGISVGVSDQANGHWGPFDGKIDDIGIWNRALSECEVAALYSGQPLTPPIVNLGSDTLSICGLNTTLDATNSAAVSYLWNTGDTTSTINISNSGEYTVTVTDTAGCSASDMVYVSIIDPTLTAGSSAFCLGDSTALSIGNTGGICGTLSSNLQTGLAAWYPFCSNADDLSSFANNGIVNGAVLDNDYVNNQNAAYSFNGTNNTINIINPFLNGGQATQFTMNARVKFNSLANNPNIWGKTKFWGEVNFGVDNNGKVYLVWANSITGNKYSSIVSQNNVITANTWCDISIVFQSGIGQIYINGQPVATSLTWSAQGGAILSTSTIENSCNFSQVANSSKLGVATSGGSSVGYLNGVLDEFKIWDYALTPALVHQNFEASSFVSTWWSDGTTNQNSIQVQPTQTTTYSVTVSDGVGSCTDSITIQVNNPQINAGSDISVCEGDSVTLTATGATTYGWDNGIVNGQAFLPIIEGYYTVVGTDTLGCSNTASVFLDLLQPTASTIERIACDTYLAPDSAIYSTSGTYTAIIPNAAGCDSTITLLLTVNNSSTSTQTATGVDSYTWPVNGQTYTQSGVYTAVIPNSKGCDSTITLNLSLEFSGISELNGKEIVITPNPVDASFTLIADSKYIGNEYVLTNQQGAIVGKGTIRATKMEVNCGHLAKGIYLFQINSTDQHVIRVMKN